MAKRLFLAGIWVVSGACGSALQSDQLPSSENSGGATGSGGATASSTPTSLGGTTSTPTLSTGGTGGAATTFTIRLDPTFDPSILVIDGGSGIDADGVHSTGIIIFDRSGSMSLGWTTAETDNPDSAVTVTKWVAASRALLGALAPKQDRVTIGAVLFPSDSLCAVAPFGDPVQFAFMPARQFIDEYIARSPGNQPDGGTPLTAAFQAADQAIRVARDAGFMQNPVFVMLLTDGEPNCNSEMAPVLEIVAAWREQGIPTNVFGLPGSESARAVLDSIAHAGGTETLVVPGSAQGASDLQGGIAAIIP